MMKPRPMFFAAPEPSDDVLAEPVDWYDIRAQADDDTTAELNIFGPIGGGLFFDEEAVTGRNVAAQLDELDDAVRTIIVRVNSPGGSVFDAIHIANALRHQREDLGRDVIVEIEALAASAATIVSSAGDPIRIPRNAVMMIHNPFALVSGDAALMRKMGDALDRIKNSIIQTYKWSSGLTSKRLGDLMSETTWMDAEEALANGFATEITDPIAATAELTAEMIERLGVPDRFSDRFSALLPNTTPAAVVETGAVNSGRPAKRSETVMKDDKKKGAQSDPQSAAPSAPEPQAPAAPEPVASSPDEGAIRTAAIREERERSTGIREAVALTELGDVFAEELVASGVSLADARAQIFDKLAEQSDATGPGPSAQSIAVVAGDDEHEKRAGGIEAALMVKAGILGTIRKAAEVQPEHPMFAALDYDGREFRGLSLLELARMDMDRRGISTAGMSRMEVAGQFFASAAAGGQQSTSDFAVGLENLLNKVLLAAYVIAPRTWAQVCSIGSVPDFRSSPRYRTGYFASLDRIYESGEFEGRDIPDAYKESIQALTYGNIVGLTRQAIVNDDMGMFNRVAVQLGRAAGLTIESGFYALLAENGGLGPAMNDTLPLFDAGHANIGAGAALSAAAIDADAELMESQTDPNGAELLALQPDVLLIPRSLKGTAIQINESQFDPDVPGSTAVSYTNGLFTIIIATPRLSGTRRYLFADQMDTPTIEVAFLDGEQDPYLEMRDGWRTDGVEWKVRHDFGISAVEFRSAVTDAGV